VNGNNVPPEEARRDIINMSEYERAMFGFYQDTSIDDTAMVLRDLYRNIAMIDVKKNISAEDIKNELAAGKLAIIPLNTRLTRHPLYRQGPIRHTVVAVGYDDQTDEIIIHDPYYSAGKYLRLSSAAVNRALWDYNSGIHLPNGPKRSAMIVVSR
ncbi:MAG: C39 family peptidase, partial [bacterium]|nr:C39 family peptidase [bacterium]